MIDGFFADFKARVDSSLQYKSKNFFPAVAIHSPYSVHPTLIKHSLNIAKQNNMVVSTHLLESRAERSWLDNSKGEFKNFFLKFLNSDKAVNDVKSFLNMFDGFNPLYVHALYTNDDELDIIEKQGAYIVHCPVSNRLLGGIRLDLERLKSRKIPFMIATDGLSSNFSVNLFNEMRISLMQQCDLDLNLLARDYLRGATRVASKALKLNSGVISKGYDADFIVFRLPNGIENLKTIYMQTIFHTNKVDEVYILGEKIR
jgi:cytosine/adenosine deaminase-related metal-dependent hydrolase